MGWSPCNRSGGAAYRARRRIEPLRLALALALACALAGCAADAPRAGAAAAPQPPADAPRIAHVVEGAALVAPILEAEAPASGFVDIPRSGGGVIRAPVHRFEARLERTGDWVGPRVHWRAAAPADAPMAPAPAASFHAAVIPAGADLADGERLRMGERTLRVLLWRREADAAPTLAPDAPTIAPELAAWLAPLRADPAQAWRAALLAERRAGLPPGQLLLEAPVPPALAGDAALAALEAQIRLRWGVALRELRRVDTDLAELVRAALTRTVRFGPDREAPAWRADANADSALLQDLLAPALSDQARLDSARAWLARQPDAIAWVIDDAAGPQAAEAWPRVGVVNLAEAPLDAQLRWSSGAAGAVFGDIAPAQAAALLAPAPATSPLGGDAATLEVSVGGWSSRLRPQRTPIVALPPGVPIRGLAPPWTMGAWLASTPAPASASHAPATAVLLQRAADDAGWELYIECARPADKPPEVAGEDAVRIFLGPRGDSRAILRVSSAGELVDELAAPEPAPQDSVGPPALPARLPHGGDDSRWWAIAPIPAWAIEKGALLRIGVERRAADARAHWPRPIFPWEDEPGRALVDLSRWSPLGGP